MKHLRLVVSACFVPWALGVLCVSSFAQEPNEMTVLRIKAKMSESYRRLPEFTTLQSIERFRGPEAEQLAPESKLRLEVGFIQGRDRFAWPGSTPFEGKSISEVVPSGSLSAGLFAAATRSVFLSTAPEFTYAGEEEREQRRCFRYTYRVPAEKSKYNVSVGSATGRVAYHGTFWVDADTLTPIRLELVADELPEAYRLSSTKTVVEYQTVALKDSEFILPKSAEVTMVDLKGKVIQERAEFSDYQPHPRPASAGQVASTSAGTSEADGAIMLPAGLRVEMLLETSLDSNATMLGNPVTAKLASDVKQDGEVLVPKGAIAHGHVVILEPVPGRDGYVALGLEFQNVVFDDKQASLNLRVETVDISGGKGSNVVEVMGMVGGNRVPVYINAAETMKQAKVTGQKPSTAIFYVRRNQLEKAKGARMIYRTEE